MTVFTVITEDDDLLARVRLGLRRGDMVRHIEGGVNMLIPRPPSGDVELVVVDLRSAVPSSAVSLIADLRQRVAADRTVIGVVSSSGAGPRVVASTAEADLGIIIADHDDVGLLLRAFANDASRTMCAAVALHSLGGLLHPTARAVASIVLGSGCRTRTGDSVAAALDMSSSGLAAHLRREGSAPPGKLIRQVRVVYALALMRFASDTIFNACCTGLLGARVAQLAGKWPEIPADAFLARILADRAAHVGKR
jgi:AraC-like DNA-binding protein